METDQTIIWKFLGALDAILYFTAQDEPAYVATNNLSTLWTRISH